ncbi:MAG: L-threonylcarbamoyladenylate synthase [Candidatus Amulumruptor caecigallinarius]|nr:L-threonylcarbamoyladenylate synthase [Candidatus Amulumruptor caecigallinarius]
METIKIWNNKTSDNILEDISARLKQGEIAVIPTDTMYAIVADALNVKAIERLCRLKNINPEKTDLSIICSDISMASEYSRIGNKVFRLIKGNTPGQFVFLLKSASTLPRAFKGRKTVGIRIPDNDFNRQLSAAMGGPLITTSIEYEDEDYACEPGLIAEAYQDKVDFMVEGERGTTNVSTIIDCTDDNPEIIRQGAGVIGC